MEKDINESYNKGVIIKDKLLKDKKVTMINSDKLISENARLLSRIFPELFVMVFKSNDNIIFQKFGYIIFVPNSEYFDIHNLNKLQKQIILHEIGHIVNGDFEDIRNNKIIFSSKYNMVTSVEKELNADKYTTNKKLLGRFLIACNLYLKRTKENDIRLNSLHLSKLFIFINKFIINFKYGYRLKIIQSIKN